MCAAKKKWMREGETITNAWLALLQFVPLVPQKDDTQSPRKRGQFAAT